MFALHKFLKSISMPFVFYAISQAMCTSFKKELFMAVHNFSASGGDTFNMALYSSSASLDATTTAYSSTNEVPNGSGYTTGGLALTNTDPTTSGTTAMATFSANPQWTAASFTTRGALIYNVTQSNKAVAVLDFGGDQTVSSGTFTVNLPAVDATHALLRLA
jgi:VCBS repeat-containing protein